MISKHIVTKTQKVGACLQTIYVHQQRHQKK